MIIPLLVAIFTVFLIFICFRVYAKVLFVAIFWFFFRLPAACFLYFLSLSCFCTLILIPIGIKLARLGTGILTGYDK